LVLPLPPLPLAACEDDEEKWRWWVAIVVVVVDACWQACHGAATRARAEAARKRRKRSEVSGGGGGSTIVSRVCCSRSRSGATWMLVRCRRSFSARESGRGRSERADRRRGIGIGVRRLLAEGGDDARAATLLFSLSARATGQNQTRSTTPIPKLSD
jgi:hypothetical protein